MGVERVYVSLEAGVSSTGLTVFDRTRLWREVNGPAMAVIFVPKSLFAQAYVDRLIGGFNYGESLRVHYV